MNEKIAKPIIMLNEEKGQQFVLSNMRERNQEYFHGHCIYKNRSL